MAFVLGKLTIVMVPSQIAASTKRDEVSATFSVTTDCVLRNSNIQATGAWRYETYGNVSADAMLAKFGAASGW